MIEAPRLRLSKNCTSTILAKSWNVIGGRVDGVNPWLILPVATADPGYRAAMADPGGAREALLAISGLTADTSAFVLIGVERTPLLALTEFMALLPPMMTVVPPVMAVFSDVRRVMLPGVVRPMLPPTLSLGFP